MRSRQQQSERNANSRYKPSNKQGFSQNQGRNWSSGQQDYDTERSNYGNNQDYSASQNRRDERSDDDTSSSNPNNHYSGNGNSTGRQTGNQLGAQGNWSHENSERAGNFSRANQLFGPNTGYNTRGDEEFNPSGSYGSYASQSGSNANGTYSGSEQRTSHFGKGPKGYKRSDERIQEDVNQALWRHHEIDATEIDVTVSNGTVTLSGTVSERPMKRAAEVAIEDLEGVDDVLNQISVQTKSNHLSTNSKTTSDGQKNRSASKASNDTMM